LILETNLSQILNQSLFVVVFGWPLSGAPKRFFEAVT